MNITKLSFEINSDMINPLDAYCEIIRMEKTLKTLKEKVQPLAVVEAQKHGKQFAYSGFEIQCKSAAGRWKYDHIPVYKNHIDYIKQLEEQAKLAYKAKQSGQIMMDENGEVIEPADYTPGSDTISLRELKSEGNGK